MASRESYNIRIRLKYRKKLIDKISFILLMLRKLLLDKYYRKLILIDNLYTPFNKLITCKISPHKFIQSDEGYWWCTKCTHIIDDKEHNNYIRKIKLLKIKKRI